MRGLSMWVCLGKWARPQISFGAPTLVRVCIGWFSFAILSVDIDMLIGTLVRDITALKAEVASLRIKQHGQPAIGAGTCPKCGAFPNWGDRGWYCPECNWPRQGRKRNEKSN